MAPCRPYRRRVRRAAAQVLGLGTIALAAGAGLFPSCKTNPAFLHSPRAGHLRPSSSAAVSRPAGAGWAWHRDRPGQTEVARDGVFGHGGAKKHKGPPHAVSVLLHDEPVREVAGVVLEESYPWLALAGTELLVVYR